MSLKQFTLEDLHLAKLYLGSNLHFAKYLGSTLDKLTTTDDPDDKEIDAMPDDTVWCSECRDFTRCHLTPPDDDSTDDC